MDISRFSFEELQELAPAVKKQNRKFAPWLAPVPREEWEHQNQVSSRPLINVLRSRYFLVQVYEEAGGFVRLSVNRTTIDPYKKRWEDGITWDDLQRIKLEAGFQDREAIEIYPKQGDVVDVANIRHLWVAPPNYHFSQTWRKSDGQI